MNLFLAITLFFAFSFSAFAENVELMRIPFTTTQSLSYTIDQTKACSFQGVKSVKSPEITREENDNIVFDTVNYFQRKLNLEIDKQYVQSDRITFSLVGATNLIFEFFYEKENQGKCKLVRVLQFDDEKYNLDEAEVIYNYSLITPVLESITLKDPKSSAKISLYPWQLRGQLSMYELNIGPAINIHTNIRVDDQNLFNKKDPVIEPIPAFFFRYGPIFLNKNGLGSLLYNSGDLSLLGMGLLEGEPYKNDLLKNRKKGIFAGGILKYNLLELTYYNDFVGDKGFNLKATLAPEFVYRLSWRFSPQIYYQYWDKNYVNYYYSVSPDEVSAQFPEYSTRETYNHGFAFQTTYFVRKWAFLVNTGIKYYGKEVRNSPTVIKGKEGRFIFSVMYKIF